MATCITTMWGDNYSPQVKLTVTQSASTDTTVTLSYTLQYITQGYAAYTNGNGRAYTITIDGTAVKTGTYDINSKSGSSYTICTGTTTVNKSTSSRNVSFSCSFNFDVTWNDTYSGTRTASGSISIGAKTSYTVSYNNNGGSGAPSSQTKWHGTALTLSSTKPTRSGYTFVGWGTSSTDTSADYSAGGSYTANASDTLYAIWKKTITLTYNANGGSGAPSSQNATIYNATTSYKFTLSSTKPTRTGYTFLGWSTSSTATSSSYSAGGSITLSSSDTLYAVWSEHALTVNYYSNYADYGTFQGTTLNVSTTTNVLVCTQSILYDDAYSGGLANVQNPDYLYLTRTGYNATGYWGTTTSGGILVDQNTSYSTGQALAQALGKNISSGNASVNIYAQWTPYVHTVTYDVNGGVGEISSQTKTYGQTMYVSSIIPTRIGYMFVEWNTKIDGTGTSYAPSQLYNYDQNGGAITLYAIWKISGVVYIDNGTAIEPYLVYIDNGYSWDLYIPYVDNGTNWDAMG